MTFNLKPKPYVKDVKTSDSEATQSNKLTPQQLLMVKHGKPINLISKKGFDCSIFNKDDVVLLIDGDWLAFSTTSNEMERYLEVWVDNEKLRFKGYKDVKAHFESLGRVDEYNPELCVRKQYNHENAQFYAMASCKKKIREAIVATGATQVVMFLGSSGHNRELLPLPMCTGYYKGQREVGWIPQTLKPVKNWLMENWLSWWAVDLEADDCIVMAKNQLVKRGIKTCIRCIDKDFLNETDCGLYVVGHHDKPVWKTGTPEEQLGEFYVKTNGSYHKPCGGGDKFLAVQTIHQDEADSYKAHEFLKTHGSLGRFGIKSAEKFVNGFSDVKSLWIGVVEFFYKYLPPVFEYEDCFGVIQKNQTPIDILDLYYKCAKMADYDGHVPSIYEKLESLGINYKELDCVKRSIKEGE